ncbi:hypothetical protein AWC26_17050 [Mycobacterium shimoidei]|nr:hypothetical protein AWC26_17050 [Mycobacterium shimoidei]
MGRRRRWVAAVALAAVLAGAGGYFAWSWDERHQKDVAASQASSVANKYVLTLINLDSKSMDSSIKEILANSTGEFKARYGKSNGVLRMMLLDHDATTHGTIVDSTVRSATPSRVELVYDVEQAVNTSDDPDPEIDRSRIKMTMDKVDGRWLASKVELQ